MLGGRTILVVEAEFLIALDLQQMLETLSAGKLLFARTAEEAEQLSPRWNTVDLAIVDVSREGSPALQLIERLRAANIPIVLSSADFDVQSECPDHPGIPIVSKPMTTAELANAVAQALPHSA